MRIRRSGILTKLIVLVAVVFGVVNLVGLWQNTQTARLAQNEVRAEIEELERRNAELEFDLRHYNDLGVIEGIARSELGLVMPGEIIVVQD